MPFGRSGRLIRSCRAVAKATAPALFSLGRWITRVVITTWLNPKGTGTGGQLTVAVEAAATGGPVTVITSLTAYGPASTTLPDGLTVGPCSCTCAHYG